MEPMILDITPETRERVEVIGADQSTYYRNAPGNWSVRMGESEEPLLDCEWIERLYQRACVSI